MLGLVVTLKPTPCCAVLRGWRAAAQEQLREALVTMSDFAATDLNFKATWFGIQ